MSDAHDIRLLNSVIDAVLETAERLESAAVDRGAPAAEFQALASARRSAAAELQAEVRRLGGRPDESGGGLISAAQRTLRETLSGGGGVLDAALRDEEALRDRFQDALEDTRLTGEVRDQLLRVYDRVKAGNDRVLQLLAERDGAA